MFICPLPMYRSSIWTYIKILQVKYSCRYESLKSHSILFILSCFQYDLDSYHTFVPPYLSSLHSGSWSGLSSHFLEHKGQEHLKYLIIWYVYEIFYYLRCITPLRFWYDIKLYLEHFLTCLGSVSSLWHPKQTVFDNCRGPQIIGSSFMINCPAGISLVATRCLPTSSSRSI